MERSVTMTYDTSISHGIEFSLGNGEYHSLTFSTLPDKLDAFVDKKVLFLYKYENTSRNNPIVNFKRKKQTMQKSNEQKTFEYERYGDVFNFSFPLINIRRDTDRENEGISFNVNWTFDMESLDSTFFVDDPSYQRNIVYFEGKSVAQYNKRLLTEDDTKHIDYLPSNLYKFIPWNIEKRYESNETLINKDIPVDAKEYSIVSGDTRDRGFGKGVEFNKPHLKDVEDNISLGTEKTKLNKISYEYDIEINTPNIFRLDHVDSSLDNNILHKDDMQKILANLPPNIFKGDAFNVGNGVNNLDGREDWNMVDFHSTGLHQLQDVVGLDIDLGSKGIPYLSNGMLADMKTKELSEINDIILLETDMKSLSINYSTSVFKYNHGLHINYDYILAEHDKLGININKLSLSIKDVSTKVVTNEYFKNVLKGGHGSFGDEAIRLDNMSYGLKSFADEAKRLERKDYEVDSESKILPIRKYEHGTKGNSDNEKELERTNYRVYDNDFDDFVENTSRPTNVYDTDIWLKHSSARRIFINGNVFAKLDYRSVTIDHNGMFLNKNPYGIYVNYNMSLGEGYRPIYINDAFVRVNGVPKGVNINEYYKTLQKYPKGIFKIDNLFINKYAKPVYVDKNNFGINKYAKPIRLSEAEMFIGKDSKVIRFEYDKLTISKDQKPVAISYKYEWIQKDWKPSSMVYDIFWVDKDWKDTNLFIENMNVSKSMKHASLNDYFEFVSKGLKKTSVYEYRFIASQSKPVQMVNVIRVGKNGIPVNVVDKLLMANVDAKGIVFNEYLTVGIDAKAIEFFKNEWVNMYLHPMRIQEEVRVESVARDIWFNNYKEDFRVKREDYKIGLNKDVRVTSDYDKLNIGLEKAKMVAKKMKPTRIAEQSNFLQRYKHNPWEDKPGITDSGKIDELILPHKDYKYNDFISKLMYDDGTINWIYVKSYDSVTGEYTVSIPLENPMHIFADIGRDYLDVDVQVLTIIIFLIQDTWKENMYKYFSMSAQDSLIDIMIKVDSLMVNYGLNMDQRKEAIRCMQLFRWYSEMAILNNCEYIMKIDTEKIGIDYYNKDLGMFQDILTFDNMEISDNYIIEPIVEGQACALSFENTDINPGLPLNLSFTLYNINTSSSISLIDDTGTDGDTTVYPEGVHQIKVQLKERVVLRYIPTGKNQAINIANVTIDNKSIRGFALTYKGKFGEINPVMQELLDSMLVVGEASDELKAKLSDVSPVTVAINTMEQYFELHHQDKLKGKRLITKKS